MEKLKRASSFSRKKSLPGDTKKEKPSSDASALSKVGDSLKRASSFRRSSRRSAGEPKTAKHSPDDSPPRDRLPNPESLSGESEQGTFQPPTGAQVTNALNKMQLGDRMMLEGYLWKKHQSSKTRKWGKRWFELDEYHKLLNYYKGRPSDKAIDTKINFSLPLNTITAVEEVADVDGHPYCLHITSTLRSFLLRTDSQDSRNRWVMGLRARVDGVGAPAPQHVTPAMSGALRLDTLSGVGLTQPQPDGGYGWGTSEQPASEPAAAAKSEQQLQIEQKISERYANTANGWGGDVGHEADGEEEEEEEGEEEVVSLVSSNVGHAHMNYDSQRATMPTPFTQPPEKASPAKPAAAVAAPAAAPAPRINLADAMSSTDSELDDDLPSSNGPFNSTAGEHQKQPAADYLHNYAQGEALASVPVHQPQLEVKADTELDHDNWDSELSDEEPTEEPVEEQQLQPVRAAVVPQQQQQQQEEKAPAVSIGDGIAPDKGFVEDDWDSDEE